MVGMITAEVLVSTEPVNGPAVTADKSTNVGIDSILTPEMRFEDLAREILSRIQDIRKKACFNIENRITTWYQAEGELAEVFQRWGDYIASERLTANLHTGVAPAQSYVEEQTIEGGTVVIGMLQDR